MIKTQQNKELVKRAEHRKLIGLRHDERRFDLKLVYELLHLV